jgi:putative hydrolase of the HAD superfamily
MKTKVIIFDADGMVISNTTRFSGKYSQEFGVDYADMLSFFEGEFQQCLVGKADLKVVLQSYLVKWKWNKSTGDFLEYWFSSEHHIDKQVVQYIQQLRSQGIVCALGTNQENYRTEYMKTKMGFAEVFDTVFSSADIGHKKPHAEFFEYILDKLLPVTKEEIWFWDDTPKNVEGAKRFGLKADLYTDFAGFKAKLDSLVV